MDLRSAIGSICTESQIGCDYSRFVHSFSERNGEYFFVQVLDEEELSLSHLSATS